MTDERNCVNCVHWSWDSGSDAYSDMTPGTDWSSDCGKGHWAMVGAGVSEQQFRDNMRTARRCADYQERAATLPNIADFGLSRQILVRRGSEWAVMKIEDCTEAAMSTVDEWQRHP